MEKHVGGGEQLPSAGLQMINRRLYEYEQGDSLRPALALLVIKNDSGQISGHEMGGGEMEAEKALGDILFAVRALG